MNTEPESWVSSPAMIRSNVDFPHPDGPTSAKNSRSATVNEMSSRTAVRPKRLEIPLSSTFAIYARARWGGAAGMDESRAACMPLLAGEHDSRMKFIQEY